MIDRLSPVGPTRPTSDDRARFGRGALNRGDTLPGTARRLGGRFANPQQHESVGKTENHSEEISKFHGTG